MVTNDTELEGVYRNYSNLMLPKVSDPLMRRFVDEIGTSRKTEAKLEELKTYRDKLVMKVTNEFA